MEINEAAIAPTSAFLMTKYTHLLEPLGSRSVIRNEQELLGSPGLFSSSVQPSHSLPSPLSRMTDADWDAAVINFLVLYANSLHR